MKRFGELLLKVHPHVTIFMTNRRKNRCKNRSKNCKEIAWKCNYFAIFVPTYYVSNLFHIPITYLCKCFSYELSCEKCILMQLLCNLWTDFWSVPCGGPFILWCNYFAIFGPIFMPIFVPIRHMWKHLNKNRFKIVTK